VKKMRRTRQVKRRQRILQAVGESALPEVLVQLRKRDVADAEDVTGSEGNTISSVIGEDE
jgi:hypothetical protein